MPDWLGLLEDPLEDWLLVGDVFDDCALEDIDWLVVTDAFDDGVD